MDIERGCLEIMLKKIPYSYISDDIKSKKKKENKNSYLNITKDIFLGYSSDVFPQYTSDEVEYIYDDLLKKMNSKNGIFDYIAEIGDEFLVYYEGNPQCKFQQILRWRDISFKLGQDLFITACLAKNDNKLNQNTDYFSWIPIIKTDNSILHSILSEGIAENHFHLNGSTQIFALSWASIMNNISERQKDFNRIDFNLDPQIYIKTGEEKKRSLYNECMIAACIRLYLFSYMKNKRQCKKIFSKFITGNYAFVNFDCMSVSELQRLIHQVKDEYGYETSLGYLDYAFEKNNSDANNNDNHILVGERKFLYDCFKNIFKDEFDEYEKNCFYIYLLIKSLFRRELIQVNGKIGFKNFSVYEDRKMVFIRNFKQYEHELVRLAINSTIDCQNVVSLEVRISPKNSGEETKNDIIYYDNHSKIKDDINQKHFYVLHFIKSDDSGQYTDYEPRNNKTRNKVEIWTTSIIQLLEMGGKYKYRVKGIDACSNEIGCRPEVFAQSFRYLKNIKIKERLSMLEQHEPIKLGATYHVGEDFFNIVDGLRAIDEAVLFCNISRCDRLGHALALGIDVCQYFELKKYMLVMDKQNMIDDTVWLIEKSKEYGIEINDELESRLKEVFYDEFKYVYGHCSGLKGNISISDYYNGWKLRGDNPSLYTKTSEEFNQYLNQKEYILQSQYYEINRLFSNNIRKNEKYRNLYYCYHFDKMVKEKGHDKYRLKVDMQYVNLVKEIQLKMMHEIFEKGISIESNPTSNYLIGTISRYDQHPLVRFNNLELITSSAETEESKSIYASINTDDQGVFDTLLENEYALMALALDKCVNERGTKKYESEMIYKWIDNIRECGLKQKF